MPNAALSGRGASNASPRARWSGLLGSGSPVNHLVRLQQE
jgi:hypothetical protein